MKRTAIAVLALIAGCSTLENYQLGTRYPPSPPPDPTAAILATERAATQPVPAPRVLVVPFPDSGLRPVTVGEPTYDSGTPIFVGDDFGE